MKKNIIKTARALSIALAIVAVAAGCSPDKPVNRAADQPSAGRQQNSSAAAQEATESVEPEPAETLTEEAFEQQSDLLNKQIDEVKSHRRSVIIEGMIKNQQRLLKLFQSRFGDEQFTDYTEEDLPPIYYLDVLNSFALQTETMAQYFTQDELADLSSLAYSWLQASNEANKLTNSNQSLELKVIARLDRTYTETLKMHEQILDQEKQISRLHTELSAVEKQMISYLEELDSTPSTKTLN